MHPRGSIFSGTLLVAGTAIGGGMLALPVLTAAGGFIPSLFIYAACWLFMAATGLLFLELSLWMPPGANILSMAEATLGRPGKIIAWLLYLFLFYCLTIAYLVGGGNLLSSLASNNISAAGGPLLFALLFAPLVIAGTHFVSRINTPLVAVLALLYVCLIVMGAPYIQWQLLERAQWPLSLMSLPVAFTAFAYQGIIPTLVTYLHRDVSTIRKAIIIGSAIPLITYIIWQGLILGIIPVDTDGGLVEALEKGENAVQPLGRFVHQPMLVIISQIFAFTALLTSFFGVTLGLMDFLADGLKRPNRGRHKILLSALVFGPPLAVALGYPHIFLIALDAAGGFGCALLLGLLPIAMVWVGRYRLHLSSYQLGGGKWLLTAMALFVVFEIVCEILLTMGKFKV